MKAIKIHQSVETRKKKKEKGVTSGIRTSVMQVSYSIAFKVRKLLEKFDWLSNFCVFFFLEKES